jgi:hypothetical protein
VLPPLKQVCGLLVVEFGQRYIALDGSGTRSSKRLGIRRHLCLVTQFARLLGGSDLHLSSLLQQLVRVREIAAFDRGVGSGDQRLRRRVGGHDRALPSHAKSCRLLGFRRTAQTKPMSASQHKSVIRFSEHTRKVSYRKVR